MDHRLKLSKFQLVYHERFSWYIEILADVERRQKDSKNTHPPFSLEIYGELGEILFPGGGLYCMSATSFFEADRAWSVYYLVCCEILFLKHCQRHD
jgi:hypothetical protein